MLIAISTYLKPLTEVDVHREEHRKYLKSLHASGKLLISGRQNPPVGGVIIARIKSLDEFKLILAEDPFFKSGMVEYKITEFNPTLFDEVIHSHLE